MSKTTIQGTTTITLFLTFSYYRHISTGSLPTKTVVRYFGKIKITASHKHTDWTGPGAIMNSLSVQQIIIYVLTRSQLYNFLDTITSYIISYFTRCVNLLQCYK